MINRRTFLKTSAAAIPMTAALKAFDNSASLLAENGSIPNLAPLPPADAFYVSVRRSVAAEDSSRGTEQHDGARSRRDEHRRVGRLLARCPGRHCFYQRHRHSRVYPSKVKFHRHGKFLNGRDFFGECVAAAKKRNMRVVARMSPDLNWGDALEAHPSGHAQSRWLGAGGR